MIHEGFADQWRRMSTLGDFLSIRTFTIPQWANIVFAVLATLYLVWIGSRIERIYGVAQELTASQIRSTALVQLRQSVMETEGAQRGFLLTENSAYLRGYYVGVETMKTTLVRVQDLETAADPSDTMHKEIEALGQLCEQKLGEMESTIADVRTGSVDRARAKVLTDQGERLKLAIVDILARLNAHEAVRRAQINTRR